MYLAGILGLCALLHVPAYGDVRGDVLFFERPAAPLAQQSQPPQQENQNPPAGESPSAPPKPDAASPAQPQDQPALEKPPTNSTTPAPDQVKPKSEGTKPAAGVAPKKQKKKSHPPQAGEEPQKRVVHRGGTVEPTTQLGPGLTDEQAAKQRQTTNQLLASTDAALQKLSGRQLTQDEQDTVAQIRRFTQQAKTADAAGDLPRAYKLAVKARLLSDALAKP